MHTFHMLFEMKLDFDNDDQAEIFMEELATEIKVHLKENESLVAKALVYITKKGQVVTPEQLDELAKEAERGYNVSSILQNRGREDNGPGTAA